MLLASIMSATSTLPEACDFDFGSRGCESAIRSRVAFPPGLLQDSGGDRRSGTHHKCLVCRDHVEHQNTGGVADGSGIEVRQGNPARPHTIADIRLTGEGYPRQAAKDQCT